MRNEIINNSYKYIIDKSYGRDKDGFIANGTESIVYKGLKTKTKGGLQFSCVLKFKPKRIKVYDREIDRLQVFKTEEWKIFEELKYADFSEDEKNKILSSYNYENILKYQNQILLFMINLCEIMEFVTGQKNILHLDIKPENIMVTRHGKELVLIDFGRSKRITKADPFVQIELSDVNMDHIEYDLTVWIPNRSDPEAMLVMRPEKVYLDEDPDKTGIIRGGGITLSNFTEDGVYALELTAVDVAGNESLLNVNTYGRLMEQDVLAYILDSNVEEKTGLFSFQYENGTPISMCPDDFSDLNIFAIAREDTAVDIVLRDMNAEEILVDAQVTTDHSIYGVVIYNFVLQSDFFKNTFSGDTDAELYLAIKNDGERIDLGKIHIDNMAPTGDIPEDFHSWNWYFGEDARMITVSNINELLDEKNCKVYDNGKEIKFLYSSEDNTLSFTLEKGWHSVGIVVCDMAGNKNNIQERTYMCVGYFWLWVIIMGIIVFTGAIAIVIIRIKMQYFLKS